jgi:hypothetical protein
MADAIMLGGTPDVVGGWDDGRFDLVWHSDAQVPDGDFPKHRK